MSEFVSVAKMIERIKIILLPHYNNDIVFQQDVATWLKINHLNLAKMKERNSPPIKEIVLFCKETKNDPMKILF